MSVAPSRAGGQERSDPGSRPSFASTDELGDLLVAGVSLVVTSLAALALGAAACENYQQTNAANNKVE